MKCLIISLFLMLSLFVEAQQDLQTSEQIQQQKALANQALVNDVVADFSTPLRVFERYYASMVSGDNIRFTCLTGDAIREYFSSDTDQISAERLRALQAARMEMNQKNHMLIEFRYTQDTVNPKIIFGWSYDFQTDDLSRKAKSERQELTLIKTKDGWKISLVDEPMVP